MSSHLLHIHARTTSTQGTLWLVIALLLLCATALAQVQTGTISGTVRDTTGAVLPGATVTITNQETGASRVATSSSTGAYEVADLQPSHGRWVSCRRPVESVPMEKSWQIWCGFSPKFADAPNSTRPRAMKAPIWSVRSGRTW